MRSVSCPSDFARSVVTILDTADWLISPGSVSCPPLGTKSGGESVEITIQW